MCGAVRFEIDAPLVAAVYCHCTRCQRRTGTAAAATARVAPGSMRIVAGEDRVRTWRPDDGWEKAFCGDCGSALYARDPADATPTAVRLGSIDGDPGLRPIARQFVAHAASWEPVPEDGLERFDERLPARP
jgi:hypothetical protein